MSGIAAAVGPIATPEDRLWVGRAARHMTFRGPDGCDAWHGERASLGHALLRTGEPAAAHGDGRPLSLDGEVWLVADVRLDGRADLLSELAAWGAGVGADAPDALLLLHAYHAWDEGCLDHLRGDFAFALWDGRRARLFCARDQLGVAPLFYARMGERLLVCNTLESLLLHAGVGDALDDAAVGDFLLIGMIAEPEATIFSSVRRLPPGHALSWEAGRLRVRRYWTRPEPSRFLYYRRPEEYVERFRELLTAAVGDRLRASRVSVPLSGGMDSTSIAAVARGLRGQGGAASGLRAYTIDLSGLMPDEEARYAAMVAESLGVPLETIDGTAYPDLDPLAPPLFPAAEPVPFGQAGLQYDLVRRMSGHGRAALSGLGGDPLLMYVPSYWLQWLARGRVGRLGAAAWHHLRLFHRPPRLHFRASIRHARALTMEPPPPPWWLDAGFAARNGLAARNRRLIRNAARQIDWRSLADSPAWATLIGRSDPGFTRHPLRFLHPFLDVRLLEFVSALPPAPWSVRKTILRMAMRDALPEAVRTRPKRLLGADPWLTTVRARGLDPRLLSLVDEADGLDAYVDRARMRETLRACADPGTAPSRVLNASLALAYWLHHWRRPTAARLDPAELAVNAEQRQAMAAGMRDS
ncbi:MAG TPA: asparagine synthase-related protein [Longimicrobiaceae bacterium]|nr:asparagine synthase-related protein [Longimicrobiaceae bacterium]